MKIGEIPLFTRNISYFRRTKSGMGKRKRTGKLGAEFILDILLEHADELEKLSPRERTDMFREEIEERYCRFP